MAAVDAIIQGLDTVILIFKWGWWLLILIAILVMKRIHSPFPIEAIIYEKRGNAIIKTNDYAGKFIDPYTQLIGYKFQKTGDTTPIPDFNHILHNARNNHSLFDTIMNKLRGNAGSITFYKYGSRQYKPVNVEQQGAEPAWEEIKDKNGQPIVTMKYIAQDTNKQFEGLDFQVVDWDNMNFMIQEQRASMERRKKKSEFWKQILIPVMIIGAAVVISIVMIKYGYDAMNSLNSRVAPIQQAAPTDSTNPNIPVISDLLPK